LVALGIEPEISISVTRNTGYKTTEEAINFAE
jgi:hypothetical protein